MTPAFGPRYTVLRRLGEGGMGEVWLAEDAEAGRSVALKLLGATLRSDPAARLRFREEFLLLKRLRHPRTVEAHDFGETPEGAPYYAMEAVPGPGLDEGLPLGAGEVRGVLVAALEGLAFLHGQGFVHGDVQPANLRRAADGSPRLMDFGLLLAVGTAPAAIQGTPLYMAPEVARRERLDGRADLYALGAVAFHLLTGRPPFDAPRIADLLRLHASAQVPDPRHEATVPDDLAALVMALLAKSPHDRPATAALALASLGVKAEPPTSLLTPAFVGREAERQAFRGALATSGPWVRLTGERGSGKTRLLEELALEAQLAGRPVVLVGHEPGSALTPLLDRLVPLAADPGAAALARATIDAPDDELTGHAALIRRASAWGKLLDLAGRALVLLDDWHLADPASRETVALLAERKDASWSLATAESGADGGAIALGSLDEAEVGLMAARCLGAPEVAPPFARALHTRTGGSPLHLFRLLETMLRQGLLPYEDGHWRTDRVMLADSEWPAIALDAPDLTALSPDATRLLALAAVTRLPMPLAEWGEALDWDEDRLASALSDLASSRHLAKQDPMLLRDPATGDGVRQTLGPEALREAHATLAQALARASAPEAIAARALHLRAAGCTEEAIPLALPGCRWLLEHYDLPSAMELARWVADRPESTPLQKSESLELLGDAHRQQGDLPQAEARYDEALELRGSAPRARLLTSLALVHQMRSRFDRALALASDAVAAAQAEGDRPEAARALTTLARLHHLAGDAPTAREISERALRASREAGARAFEAEALGLLGYLAMGRADLRAEGRRHLETCLSLREELGDRVGLNDAYMFLGNAQLAEGDFPAALDSFTRNLALCREIGAARSDSITALINLALVAGELGDTAQALAHVEAAVTQAREIGDRFLQGYALGLRGRLRAPLGQLAEALEDSGEARSLAEALESRYLGVAARANEAEILVTVGDGLAALEVARVALETAETAGIEEYRAELRLSATKAYLELGDTVRAATELDTARTLAEEAGATHLLARAALLNAHLSLVSGNPEATLDLLREGRELARQCGMRPQLAEADVLEGRWLAEQGRGLEATRLCARAYADAQEAGHLLRMGEAGLALRHADSVAEAERLAASVRPRLEAIARTLAGPHASWFRKRWLPAHAPAKPVADQGMGTLIADFGRLVTGTLRYEEALDRVIDQVMALTGADRGMILLVDDSGALSGLVTRPLTESGAPEMVSFSRSFVQTVLKERQSLWVADAQNDARFATAQSVLAMDLRTVLCVPLIAEDAIIGLLYVDQQSINRSFTQDDLRLVEGLAGFAALAIANARRFEETLERNRLLTAIQELSQLVSTRLDRNAILSQVLDQAMRVSGAPWGQLFGADADLPLRTAGGDSGFPAGAVRRAQETAQASTFLEAWEPAGRRSGLVVPLVGEKGLCGVLCLQADPQARTYGPGDLPVVEAIAAQAAFALEQLEARETQARRIERLERMLRLLDDQRDASLLDELTGLFAPDYFARRLDEELAEAERYGTPVTLILLCPKGLEELRERFGDETLAGVLRQLGEELRGATRRTDIVSRLDTDRFAVLMPQTPQEGAAVFAERLRARLEELAICDDEGQELWVLRLAMAEAAWHRSEGAQTFFDRAFEGLEDA